MNILFLDDSPARRKEFRSNCPAAVFAETATECIDLIQTKPMWHTICLDHDLEGVYQDSSEQNCGMEVVRWIVNNHVKCHLFICHSHNPDGRARMAQTLLRRGYTVSAVEFGIFDRIEIYKLINIACQLP